MPDFDELLEQILAPRQRATVEWLKVSHAERGCGVWGRGCTCTCADHFCTLPDDPDGACPACHGDGWVAGPRVPIGDPRFGKALPCRECDVVLPQLAPALPWADEAAFAPERLDAATRPAVKQVQWWLAGGSRARPWLVLAGGTGTGKTSLATYAAFQLARARHRVRLETAKRILDALKATFDDAEAPTDLLLDAIAQIDVLIIDDLGAEHGTAWATSELLSIVDRRYTAKALTVLTTNRLPSPALTGRLWSRVYGDRSMVVRLPGPDRRPRRLQILEDAP
jgi:DNA replication protein DnaC